MEKLSYRSAILESPVLSEETKAFLLENELSFDEEAKNEVMLSVFSIEEYVLGILRESSKDIAETPSLGV